MGAVWQSILEYVRSVFIKFICKCPIQLLSLYNGQKLYTLPDAFGSVEENLLDTNIYFTPSEISQARTIIDPGAHVGSFTLYAILHAREGAYIVAVEPNPSSFRVLLRNIGTYRTMIASKRLRVSALRKAVAREEGQRLLKITTWSETPYLTSEQMSDTIMVNTVSMRRLLQDVQSPVIVKMDIEGEEYELFEEDHWLQGIDALAIETHRGQGTIISKLYGNGFLPKLIVCHINRTLACR